MPLEFDDRDDQNDDEDLDLEEENVEEEDQEGQDEETQVSVEEYQKLLRDKQKLEQAVKQRNKENEKNRLKMKQLKEAGIEDLDAVVELQKKLEEQQKKQAIKQGNVEKLQQQFEERLEKERGEYKSKLEAMQKSLHETLVTKEIHAALNSEGAQKGADKYVAPLIERHVSVQEDDGKYSVVVLDDDGDAEFNPDGSYKSIADKIKEMKTDELFSNFFVQSNHSGTGSTTSPKQKGSGKGQVKSKSQMTNSDKAAYIAEHGMEAYLKLK